MMYNKNLFVASASSAAVAVAVDMVMLSSVPICG